jgi:hypothetical protein
MRPSFWLGCSRLGECYFRVTSALLVQMPYSEFLIVSRPGFCRCWRAIWGRFRFHELLTRVAPDVVDGDVEAYAAARNPEIDCNKIIHFALVHSWSGSRTAPMINLDFTTTPRAAR